MQLLWIKYLYLWKASDGYQWPGITTGKLRAQLIWCFNEVKQKKALKLAKRDHFKNLK